MKALLINPWIYDFAAYDLWSKPIGLLKIADLLKAFGFEIDLIDCLDRFHPALNNLKKPSNYTTVYNDGHYLTEEAARPEALSKIPRRYKRYGMPLDIFEEILKKKGKPDIIFVGSGLTYWYHGSFLAIQILKKRFNAPVVLGGVYATLCYAHAKKLSLADYVFKGSNLNELINYINKQLDIALKIKEFDELGFYYTGYKLYPQLRYVTLRTSRGCPYKCSYCGWYMLDKRFLQYPAEKIIDIIEYFNSKKGIKDFSFYDDALLYKPDNHFKKIFHAIIKKDLKCNFHTPNALHCRFLDEEIAYLMKESGFINPRLGFEGIIKTTKVDKDIFLKALKCLIKAGYEQKDILVNILAGLPGQRIDEVEESIDFAAGYGAQIKLEEYSPVPGSEDFKRSSLKETDDPLLHNNVAYSFSNPEFSLKMQDIKNKVHKIGDRASNNY